MLLHIPKLTPMIGAAVTTWFAEQSPDRLDLFASAGSRVFCYESRPPRRAAWLVTKRKNYAMHTLILVSSGRREYEPREMVATKRMFFDFCVCGFVTHFVLLLFSIGKMRIHVVSLHRSRPSMRFRSTEISLCSRSRLSRS